MNSCRAIAGCTIICMLVAVLFLLSLYVQNVSVPRRSPAPMIPRRARTGMADSSSTCRLRFVNIQLLPIPYLVSMRDKATKLHKNGLFNNVDVVFIQEAFSRIFIDKSDFLTYMGLVEPKLQLAATESAIPFGYFTDSGLAAAASDPWSVTYVASKAFTDGTLPCSLAYKSVSVFEVNAAGRVFRVANTHLQSDSSNNEIQQQQFEAAVKFAVLHGAVIIGGDVNVAEKPHLLAMTQVVREVTLGKGAFVSHDNQPTCCKSKHRNSSGRYKYATESRIDHVWILDASKVSCKGISTQDAFTDGASDHACLDLTLHFVN